MLFDRGAARRYGMALTALLLLCAVVPVATGMVPFSRRPAHATSADWPMFLGNDARTGYNSDETAVNPTTAPGLHVLWTFPTGGRINAQPIVANGSLYFGSWDGKEYATNSSGKQLWNASIGGQTANCSPPDVFGVGSTPSVAEVTINQSSTAVLFVGGKDPTLQVASLYALNATDGTTLWGNPP